MRVSVLVIDDSQPMATFLGLADDAGHFWQVYWVDGANPEEVKMLTDQIDFGKAPTFRFLSHAARSLFLLNNRLPSGLRNGMPWAAGDFGAAPFVTGG